MPHSSGGGSHSGGSHSSSHSSHHSRSSGGGSSGGSLSSRRSSGQPFPGSKRYLYYRDNKPYFIYTNYDIRKPDMTPRITAFIVFFAFLLPFLLSGVFCMFTAFTVPQRIENRDNKNPKFIVEDNIDVIEDKRELKKSMEEFYDITGIIPAVITVSNEDWNEDYTSLENYAYDLYVNRFDDESHWLIVYSESIKDNGFNDWYWEGMQGDDTDPVLTERRADAFTVALQEKLLQRNKYSVDAAIGLTLKEHGPKMMKLTVNTPMFVMGIFIVLIMGGVSWYSFAVAYKPAKVPEEYKNAQVCELTAVYQEPCNFCGGIFIIGMHTTCPHCGAALPAHHYIKDAQGNVVQLI